MGERVVLPEVYSNHFCCITPGSPEHPTRQVVLAYVLADLLDLPKADTHGDVQDGLRIF